MPSLTLESRFWKVYFERLLPFLAEQKTSLLCEFAKDIAVLENGKIIMQGTAKEILARGRELAAAGVAVPPTASLAVRLREKKLYDGPAPVDLGEAAAMVRSTAA